MRKMNELHKELLCQVEELLSIDIGNYIYEKGETFNLKPFINTSDGGIDFYINDPEYTVISKNKKFDYLDFKNYFMVDDIFSIDDILLIGHYHYEELLYLIIHYQEEKTKMIKKIDKYIDWKMKK